MEIEMALRASESPTPPTGRLRDKRADAKRDVGRRENKSAVFQAALKQTQKQTQTNDRKHHRPN